MQKAKKLSCQKCKDRTSEYYRLYRLIDENGNCTGPCGDGTPTTQSPQESIAE